MDARADAARPSRVGRGARQGDPYAARMALGGGLRNASGRSRWQGRAAGVALALTVLALAAALAELTPNSAWGEAASQPGSALAGRIDAGDFHTCAILDSGAVRCWGEGGLGRLGYGNTKDVGDNETPGSVGPVKLGAGRTATAISAGSSHTCALLDNGAVRCWGSGGNGRLGYGNTNRIGDNETPGSVGPVDLGPGRSAVAISAGEAHTCAILDNGAVHCWGVAGNGQLGYGNTNAIGDNETPGSVGPVDLGPGRSAVAISAGYSHTCAILDNGAVRCWGSGPSGELGYGNTDTIGDDETPGSVGPSISAPGAPRWRSAPAASSTPARSSITARCGAGATAAPASSATATPDAIGDDETPGSVGPVNLGAGRRAVAISAGGDQTCGLLDNGAVRCWGYGGGGLLGYGNITTIGDNETPGPFGPVDLGAGRSGTAISAGVSHTCAILDNSAMRCWGSSGNGELGYGNTNTIGDNETPGSVGPVDLLGLSQRPVFGKRAEASPVSGVVKVKLPGSGRFVILRVGRSIPIGSIIDTRSGRVRILSADGKSGETRVADFFEGLFKLRQGKKTRGYTDAKLVGPLACGKSRSSATASKGRRGRHVWGSGKGRHSSTGKNSSGSVRGTEWLVWDRCDGSTLTFVKSGRVLVRDFRTGRKKLLRKGQRYVAKPRRGRSGRRG